MHYVYKIFTDDEIIYIGKGNGNRMYDHIKFAKKYNPKNSYPRSLNMKLINKLLKLISSEVEIFHEKLYETSIEDDAYDVEESIIDEIGLENLTNLTRGGRGGRKGYKHSEVNAAKFRKTLIEKAVPANIKANKGKKKDPIKNKKQADSARIVQREILSSPEIRRKAANTQRGVPCPQRGRPNVGKSNKHKQSLSISATNRFKDPVQRENAAKKASKEIGIVINKVTHTFASQKAAAAFLNISENKMSLARAGRIDCNVLGFTIL